MRLATRFERDGRIAVADTDACDSSKAGFLSAPAAGYAIKPRAPFWTIRLHDGREIETSHVTLGDTVSCASQQLELEEPAPCSL